MPPDLVIRPAADADRDTLQRLLTAQLVENGTPSDAEGIARGIDHALRPASASWLWLAEREGQPLAVVLANEIASVEHGGIALWIEELYVVPEARRQGIALAVLNRVSEEARRRNIRAIDLEVIPTQSAAFALYEVLGFKPVHRSRLSLRLHSEGDGDG
jgi:GNAT superfamily N-acetyltransferase